MGSVGQTPDQLFATLYDELTSIAQRELRRAGSDLTLSATMLLHESYLGMTRCDGLTFRNRSHFKAYAARAMRRVLIDQARSRIALKRGGQFEFTSLSTEEPECTVNQAEIELLEEAVERLIRAEPRLAEVVELKYFGGLSFADIAAMRGVSERTVQRDWDKARLFLHRLL